MEPADYAAIADLYDTYVRTDLDVGFFLEEAGDEDGEVLELMCGTGRVTLPLAERGCRLTCVDACPEMLDVLRGKLGSRGLSADVREGDVRELALGKRFRIALLPFHSFSEIVRADDRRLTLARVAAHLEDGGKFLLSLHNPPVRLRSVDGVLRERGRWPHPEGAGDLVFLSREVLDHSSGVVTAFQRFDETDERGVVRRSRRLDLPFVLPPRDEVEEMARDAGLVVEALYGDYSRAPFSPESSPFLIWVLRR